MKSGKYILIALFLFYGLRTIRAQANEHPQDIQTALDTYMVAQMARLKIPGAAVGIVQGDQVLLVKGYGIMDARQQKSVTPQTPFYLASISKSFTALGIMQLVEAGALDLDTPVVEILPWFQINGEGAETMTVRHLLNQTSGFSERGGYIRNLEPDGPNALETSIRALADDTLNRVPGSGYEYSNTNFDVAGLIIETISGQPYGEYIQDNIFDPLQMTHSFTTLETARANGMSTGFYPFMGIPIPFDRWIPYTLAIRPSAGLIASAEDMSHYLLAHLNGGQYQGMRILSPKGIDTLHTPGVTIANEVSYAMGWVTFPFEDAATEGNPIPTAISHAGAWTGFMSSMILLPDRQLGVITLTNIRDPLLDSAYHALAWDVALIASGLAPAYFPPSEDFLTRYGRELLGLAIFLLVVDNLFWFRRRDRRTGLWMGLSYLSGLILSGYILFVIIPSGETTFWLMTRFSPDIALLYLVIFTLTLGVGTARAGRMIFAHTKRKTT